MAHLKVRLRGKTVQSYPLVEGKVYVVGRKEDCDIVLQPEKGISREHFKMSCSAGVWTVEVISRYGDIMVGGEKSQNFNPEHGQIFAVPPYEFEFLMTSAESMDEQRSSSERETPEVEAASNEKTFVGAAPSVPYVKVVNSAGEAKEIFRLDGGDSWIAGRESSCHVQIRDQRVSRRQFEIRKINSFYYIIDLGSVNGTLLNGSPISSSDPTLIRSGDGITVLENNMFFELHDPHFKNRMEMVRLQPLTPQPILSPLGGQDMVGYGHPHFPATYDPNLIPMSHEMSPVEVRKGLAALKNFDFKKNRIKVIAGAILFLALVYYISDDKPKGPPPNAIQDPFSKLKPEQQLLVKQSYQLAKNLYMQGKYELSQNEITKITELVPDYEDIKEIQRLSREAIFIQDQKRHQEEVEKAKAEAEEKIQIRVAECTKKINSEITMARMEECISDVMQFNPDHPKIAELKAKVEKIIAEREARDAAKSVYADQVRKLKELYGRGNSLRGKSKNLEAIKVYRSVANSSLPDPSGVKKKSELNINELRQMMNSKTALLQQEAEKLAQAGNLKGAIMSLRKARLVDPENDTLVDKITHYTGELRKQMMTLYQEGILEESFGNVEGSESKAGAKDKWKRILEQDITDGEYYKKAYIKLKKYGAF